MTSSPKYNIGDFVRDQVSQQLVRIENIILCRGDDSYFWVYHTTAGPDKNYPDGHRLENEIADRDFIGPLATW